MQDSIKVKEVIVVEGKNDTKRLKSFLDCETIETQGLALNKKTLSYIKEVSQRRGVILLLDPDGPGNKIRARINEAIPGLKNAFVDQNKAHGKRKIGIEHASKEAILEALDHLISYQIDHQSISLKDFNALGLNGREDAFKRRKIVSAYFHLGDCNAKTCFKRLNLLGLSLQDVEEVLAKHDEKKKAGS